MGIVAGSEIIVCEAREFCTNTNCRGEILALPIGETTTQLAVRCEQVEGGMAIGGVPEGYPAPDLATDYKEGDDIAYLFLLTDAPVCCDYGPGEIRSPGILFNGEPVVTEPSIES